MKKKKKDFPQISELSFHAIKVSIQKKKNPIFHLTGISKYTLYSLLLTKFFWRKLEATTNL